MPTKLRLRGARSCTRILAHSGLASSTMLSIVADHKEFPDHVSVRLVTDTVLLWPHASLCTHLAATPAPVSVHQQRSDRSVCRLAATSGQRPHRSEASSGAAVPLQVRSSAAGHLYVDRFITHRQSDPHLAVQHPDTGEAGRPQAELPSRSVLVDCCAYREHSLVSVAGPSQPPASSAALTRPPREMDAWCRYMHPCLEWEHLRPW